MTIYVQMCEYFYSIGSSGCRLATDGAWSIIFQFYLDWTHAKQGNSVKATGMYPAKNNMFNTVGFRPGSYAYKYAYAGWTSKYAVAWKKSDYITCRIAWTPAPGFQENGEKANSRAWINIYAKPQGKESVGFRTNCQYPLFWCAIYGLYAANKNGTVGSI